LVEKFSTISRAPIAAYCYITEINHLFIIYALKHFLFYIERKLKPWKILKLIVRHNFGETG